MKHRFWFVFLAVCLLLSVGALAADRDSETGITYTIENGEATIVKCDFTGKTLEIPASLGGCPVREIGSRAFFDMKSLEDVTIPNTVQRIGDHAFSASFFLKSVTLPSSVTELGMGVFASCDWLQQADLSALRITRLPDGTFRDCGRLVTVLLPDSLTALGDRCFYETRDLMRLSLPRGLTTFGRECFAVNCGLESFAFPVGTTEIPEGCFYQCSRLKSVTLPETVTTIGKDAFRSCNNLTAMNLPRSLRTVEESGLAGVGWQGTLRLPEGLTTLGKNALSFLDVEELILPESLRQIGEGAFRSCRDLKRITLPSGLTEIPDYAFADCSALEEITLPASIRKIGENVFYGTSVKDVYYLGTEAQWKQVSVASPNAGLLDGSTLVNFGPKTDPIYGMRDMPAPDEWSYPGIAFCLETGLMNGMDRHVFAPNANTTRAQMVTILWRMAGAPRYDFPIHVVVDLTQDWYKPAVEWAFRAKITTGTGEYIGENGMHLGRYFSPDENVTRQELVAFLYRFTDMVARKPVTGDTTDLSRFPDAESVSGWANAPVRWAVANGILHGNEIGGTVFLDPLSHATRAQIATLMRNYVLYLSEY